MTFKDFQKQYIDAYKNKKPIDAPKELFDDEQKVYDTFIAQTEYAMVELNTNTKLTFKERVDAVALIDFCTTRCMSIINTYKDICNTIADFNRAVEKDTPKKA